MKKNQNFDNLWILFWKKGVPNRNISIDMKSRYTEIYEYQSLKGPSSKNEKFQNFGNVFEKFWDPK